MDSGNSCSLNSSSGGDDQDQYDHSSRNTHDSSISAFLSNTQQVNNNSNIFSNSNQQQPPPLHPHMSHDNHHQQQQSSINFDHLSNYLNPFSSSISSPQTPNSLLNLDMVWPKNIMTSSEPNNNTLMGSSSSAQQHNQYMGGNIHFSNPLVQPSLGDGSARVSSDSHQQKATRNPKKRTRASRRAPTTVLTTDTSNFRAMVQEFTGIPAAPFSASTSVFPRSRFDLFNTSSTGKQSGLSAPPPYLLRPFPQKVNHQLPTSSTSINTTGTSNSDHHCNEPQNLLNVQNLTFQSLLNPNHHQQSNAPILFGHHDKSKVPLSSLSNDNSQLRMAAMEEFNMNANTTATTTTTSHGILGGTLSNIVDTSNDMTLGINSGSHHNVNENNDHLGSSFSGNYNYSQQASGSNSSSNCKMNFTGSSTDNVGFDNVGDGFNKR
ncbi:hypothetical protein MKW94_022726 [Papaver nudicaule]|uniref:VQ domain-containing protein n=1 Tax=Papaver nudicaule TaxID=74823 RepID=A0AA41VY42_PAPNU|nr:hypothetical protein [Papaver nudicaule]